jgi:putative PIN family toxin of toxin-antitoxin system
MFSDRLETQVDVNIPKNGPVPGRPVAGQLYYTSGRATKYYMNTLTVRIPDELRSNLQEISCRRSVPVFELCLDSHEIMLSEPLLEEVRRDLAKKLKLDRQTIEDIERLLRDSGAVFEPAAGAAGACRDAGDLHVLGLAKAGRADYIITGDGDLLLLKRFGRCRIVTPRQFWSLVREAR